VIAALGNPEARARLRQIELAHEAELTRMHIEAETARLVAVNQTMRAETVSQDPYVRRWRPTFGYLTAAAWALQCGAIAWSIVASPEHGGTVAQTVTALTPMWGVALAVLGINVTSRSRDKQVAASQQPQPGILQALAARIGGRD